MTDQEAFKKWYLKDYGVQLWDEFNADEVVERTWFEACRYKQEENSELVMKLKTRINSLIAENAKLFEEAKRELAYKDKKIAYLEAECERVYHPIREFWNQEKDEEVKRLQKENQEMRIKIANHVEWTEGFHRLERENKRLKREVEVLRLYGNKDCTAMADEVLEREP